MFSEGRKNSTDWVTELPSLKNGFRREEKQNWLGYHPCKMFSEGKKTVLIGLPPLKNIFRREEKQNWLDYHPWKMFSEGRKNSTDWATIPEKCFQKGGKTVLTELSSLKNVFRREEKQNWLGYHPWKMFSEGRKNSTDLATTPEKCFQKGGKTVLTELSSLKNVFRREEKQNWLGYHPWKMFSKGRKTVLTGLPPLKNVFRREEKQYWLGYHPWKMFSEGRKNSTDWATTTEKCFQKGGKTVLTGLPPLKNVLRREEKQHCLSYHPWKMFSEGRKNRTDLATTPEKWFQKREK